jgi:hypothetical protein
LAGVLSAIQYEISSFDREYMAYSGESTHSPHTQFDLQLLSVWFGLVTMEYLQVIVVSSAAWGRRLAVVRLFDFLV